MGAQPPIEVEPSRNQPGYEANCEVVDYDDEGKHGVVHRADAEQKPRAASGKSKNTSYTHITW